MTFWEVFAIAIGLAMDATAVSLAAGANAAQWARASACPERSRRVPATGEREAPPAGEGRFRFRLAFHFGLFQFMMPVAGWLIGATLARHIAAVDHWVAFGILAFVGGRMIAEGCSGERSADPRDPSRGLTLVMLSLATSIDALAVGLSLAMLDANIWWASVTIGAVTGALSALALRAGSVLGAAVGRRMEVAGGLILVGIGTRILLSSLGGG